MAMQGGTDTTHAVSFVEEELSSSPSPTPSLASSVASTVDISQSIDPAEVQSMVKMRFLASQWKRRSLSGGFRSSKDLKEIFDNLDKKDADGCDYAPKEEEVAEETHAVQLEVAAASFSDGQSESTTSLPPVTSPTSSTASLPPLTPTSLSSSPPASGIEDDGGVSPRRDDKKRLGTDRSQTPERRRGSLLRRAKKALGISSELPSGGVYPKDHPVSIFNSCDPNEAIEKLALAGVLSKVPSSVADFLYTTPHLNKFKIGEYVGTMNEFNIQVLHELVKRLDCSQLDFDMALRHLLYCFRLPGEAQKINRIMDAFGSHYFSSCNNSVFVNADAAQIMAFSAIMLTTDAHNPRVAEKMTKSQFVALTRGMNGEGNFPKDFLEYVYEKVVDEPLIRIDHNTIMLPYATKRGWLFVPRKKSWKRYYALLHDATIYFFRKPMDTKYRRKISTAKLSDRELPSLASAPTQWCIAISGIGEGLDVSYLCAESHRDLQGWMNALS